MRPVKEWFTPLVIVGMAASACGTERSALPVEVKAAGARQRNITKLAHPEYYIERGRRTIRGAVLLDGCQFSSADSVRPGQRATEWSVDYDPAACTLTLAQGDYVGPAQTAQGETRIFTDTLRPLATSRTTLLNGRRAPIGSVRRLDDPPTCDNTLDSNFHAYQHLWAEDPLGIHVSQDYLHVYYFSRPELNCIQDGTYGHTAAWYTDSGWQLTQFTTNFAYIANDRSYIIANVTSMMINSSFCYPGTATTSYNPSEAKGFPDGVVVFYWDVSISGACSGLLGFHREAYVEGS